MHVEETTNLALINFIMTIPALHKLATGHELPTSFNSDMSFRYMLVKEADKLICMFPIRQITNKLIESHVYTIPQYWGTGKSLEAASVGIKWLKEHTSYKTIITYIPEHCLHSIKYAVKAGYSECGKIKDGIVYGHKLQNLLIFEREIT